MITFNSEDVKKKFVSLVAIRFRESLSVINDEDMPLTFLNIYDAPYELSDEALKFRLRKYCIVHSTRRGRFVRSHVNNGIRHFRIQIINPLPSYLRFGKFLVRLSHDGQQHTCRRCNRADHFANECKNVVCFNCNELGHQSKECDGPVLCCICKSPNHRARRCPFAWHQSSEVNACASGLSSGGRLAAPAGDPSSDPVSGGDVTAPASDLVRPPVQHDFLRAISASQVSASSSGPRMLDQHGFLRRETVVGRSVPNPPGPQSSGEQPPDSAEQLGGLSVDPPANPSGSSVSADLPTVSTKSPGASVDPSDVPLVGPSADPALISPVVIDDDPSSGLINISASDQPVSSPAPPGKNRSSSLSRRKPAPMPAALEALARCPTRPSLPVSGKSVSTPLLRLKRWTRNLHLNVSRSYLVRRGNRRRGNVDVMAFLFNFILIFRVLTINVQGLNETKLDLISDYLNRFNIDVCFVQET